MLKAVVSGSFSRPFRRDSTQAGMLLFDLDLRRVVEKNLEVG
jgi:hypothetical protein